MGVNHRIRPDFHAGIQLRFGMDNSRGMNHVGHPVTLVMRLRWNKFHVRVKQVSVGPAFIAIPLVPCVP